MSTEDFIASWEPTLIRGPEDVQWNLDTLARYLAQTHQHIFFGPLPGAYFVFTWEETDPAILVTGNFNRRLVNWKMKPLYVGVVCIGGDITVDIHDEGVSILTAGSLSTTSNEAIVNKAQDFASDQIGGDGARLRFDIDSIDSGTPVRVSCMLVCKNIGKIEPVPD
ncbi:MAG: hypothetical protein V3W37_06185 [Candidatus Binatia bacterium]